MRTLKRVSCNIAKAGPVEAAVDQPVLTSEEFVTDERGEEIDRGEVLGLRLEQPWLQAGGHAGAAKLTQGARKSSPLPV
jgi:hypothetical protein